MAKQGLTDRQRFWLEHLRAWQGTEESLAGYAARHNLDVRLLYDAKAKFTRKGLWEGRPQRKPRFVRAEVTPALATVAMCRVHLPNGTVVEIARTPSSEAWREVLEAASRL